MNFNEREIITKLVEVVDIFIRRYTMEYPIDRAGNLHADMEKRLDNIKKLLENA